MKRNIFVLTIFTTITLLLCGLKTAKDLGLHFSTEKLSDPLNGKKIGLINELINQKEMVVIHIGGSNILRAYNITACKIQKGGLP